MVISPPLVWVDVGRLSIGCRYREKDADFMVTRMALFDHEI